MSIVPRAPLLRLIALLLLISLIVLAGCTSSANPTNQPPDVLPIDDTPQWTVIPPADLVTGTPTPLTDEEYGHLWQELRANIRADHGDVYAAVGPWVTRFPVRRPCLVALTVDPLPIVQQYEAGRRLMAAGELELRTVDYTEAELDAATDRANQLIWNRLDLPDGFVSYVSQERDLNRVVVYAIDPLTVALAARDARVTFPESVVIMRPEWLSAEEGSRSGGGPFTYTNAQGQEIVYVMRAMYIGPVPLPDIAPPFPERWGVLAEVDGCLRFVLEDGSQSIIPIWRNPLQIDVTDQQTRIDDMVLGERVAIHFGGKPIGAGDNPPNIPDPRCPGPYESVYEVAYRGDSFTLPPDVTATASPTVTPAPD